MQIFSCSEVIKQRLRYTVQWPAYVFCGGNDMRNRFAVIPNFKLNKQFFPERPPPPDTGCWLSPGWLCTRLAAKWPLRANKSLPKFTPIFLILPQTLVVCQNWLASNLEKDILRKCQKCRRMEDNSECCSLARARIISNSQALLAGPDFFTLPHQRYTISDGLSPYLAKTMAYYLHWEMNCTAEIMRNFQMCKSC